MVNLCPVCSSLLQNKSHTENWDAYDCKKCGSYKLLGLAETVIENIGNDLKRAVFSHALRKMQRDARSVEIDTELAERIVANGALPSAPEQADNLVLWFGENAKAPGETMEIATATHQAVIGAASDSGVRFIVAYLVESGLLVKGSETYDIDMCVEAMLSVAGWGRYAQLKGGIAKSRKAFMAMPYGDAVLDGIVANIFKPAVTQTGFNLFRLDDVSKAGLIDDHLRVEILASRFLIADLTHGNKGAYWEAGYAEGLGKPVIYTCEKSVFEKEKSHFDTNHHLTVTWSEDDAHQASEKLKATIRATLPDEANLSDD